MSLVEKIPINTDYDQDTEQVNYGSRSESARLSYKPKNWPPCSPILRHNIKEDIPHNLQATMKIALFHCFYVVIILLLNFITAYLAAFGEENWVERSCTITNFVLSIVWLFLWSIIVFGIYSFLYKAIAYRRKNLYPWFIAGSVLSAVLAVLAVCGFPYTGLYGFIVAFYFENAVIGMSFAFAVLAGVDFFYVVISTAIIHNKYKAFRASEPIVVAGEEAIAGRVGTTNALPSEIDGRKISYLPVNAGQAGKKIEKLTALPNNSLTVIDEWKKVESGNAEGTFVLYVEGNHERMYWGDEHVAGIIGGGEVDASTQVLTISRLENGEFVFGVADKN